MVSSPSSVTVDSRISTGFEQPADDWTEQETFVTAKKLTQGEKAVAQTTAREVLVMGFCAEFDLDDGERLTPWPESHDKAPDLIRSVWNKCRSDYIKNHPKAHIGHITAEEAFQKEGSLFKSVR